MNIVEDILTGLKGELEMVDTSTLFTDATLILNISNAHLWAGDQHDWPQLEKAKRSFTTDINGIVDEYYDYPSEFKSDSIHQLEINGVTYFLKSWDSYKIVKREGSLPADLNIFATFGRQFFLNRVPSASGLPIDAWGQIQAPPLNNLTDKTIFSDSEASLNEAIMRKALATSLASAGNKEEGIREQARATIILASGFKKILDRRQRAQEMSMPRFNVPDMFSNSRVQFAPGNIQR